MNKEKRHRLNTDPAALKRLDRLHGPLHRAIARTLCAEPHRVWTMHELLEAAIRNGFQTKSIPTRIMSLYIVDFRKRGILIAVTDSDQPSASGS